VKMQELLITLRGRAEPKPNSASQAEIVTLPLFDGEASKVGGFVIVCKLYLKMRIRESMVEEQMQWVLMYIQEGMADV